MSNSPNSLNITNMALLCTMGSTWIASSTLGGPKCYNQGPKCLNWGPNCSTSGPECRNQGPKCYSWGHEVSQLGSQVLYLGVQSKFYLYKKPRTTSIKGAKSISNGARQGSDTLHKRMENAKAPFKKPRDPLSQRV